MNKEKAGVGTPTNEQEEPNTIIDSKVLKGFDERNHDPKKYFKGKRFVAKLLADDLTKAYTFRTMSDTDEIYVYEDGVYTNRGGVVVKSVAQHLLGMDSNNTRVAEVVGHITRETWCDRSEFDCDSNIINLSNGLFYIDTMSLVPHTSEYLSLRKSPIVYDPEATCERVTWFINDVLQEQDVSLMLELFGYALMPQKRMNAAAFLTGGGRNGKSTMIDLLTAFVGEHLCSEITPSQMSSEDRFSIVDLHGMLVNKIDDLGDTPLKDLGRFKSVVASKSVRGERKFKNPFSFTPQVLCLFACNTIPKTEDTSEGFFSRVHVIPFLNRYVGESDNKHIIDELTACRELSGLFNMAIVAAKDAVMHKEFSGGKTIADKQREYVYASNPIARFVDDECSTDDVDDFIQKDNLYNQYVLWSRDHGLQTQTKGELTQYLERIGVSVRQRTIDEERVRVYVGIRLNDGNSDGWF